MNSEYFYFKVVCEEVGYISGELATQEEANDLACFLINHCSNGIVFDIKGFIELGLSTTVATLRRETPQEELVRIEKLFHYQESLMEPWG